MAAARVLIDDHEVVHIGLRSLFETGRGYTVCGEASNGREAVKVALQLEPDLVILDIGLPVLNGLEAARQILSMKRQPSILVHTKVASESTMQQALQMGIRGFTLKCDPGSYVLSAAEALMQGRTFFTSSMTEMVLASAKKQGLKASVTQRESEILQLLAEGNCSKDIGAILDLSTKTVETHRSNLMRKLRLHSIVELILYAVRTGIIQVPCNAGSPHCLSAGPDQRHVNNASERLDEEVMAPMKNAGHCLAMSK
jgi:DNA-binding NarL/FixJ family response regulator